MATAYNLSASVSAPPKSPAGPTYTTERHRDSLTVQSHSRSSRLHQTDRRYLTWTAGRFLETEVRKPRKVQCRRFEGRCNAEVPRGTATGSGGEETVPDFDISRLEAYTERFRSEVLCVNALIEDDAEEEEDQVIVFKGYSSSLTRPTPEDPSEPALPPTALIQSIDRMRAPYNPSKPQHIEQGISWQQFHELLEEKGL